MIDDRTRQLLNDYLDGRLDDAARREFEQRLQGESDLARDFDAARELRAVLRSGDEELSPGFYTRTVARFETEQRPRARLPFGLTWSSAGLATVAIAAAAIFIPMALRDEIRETPARPEMSDGRLAPEAKDSAGPGSALGPQVEGVEIESSFADAEDPANRARGQAEGIETGRLDSPAPMKKEAQDKAAEGFKLDRVAGEAEEKRNSVVLEESTADRKQPARQKTPVVLKTKPLQVPEPESEPVPIETTRSTEPLLWQSSRRSNEAAGALREADVVMEKNVAVARDEAEMERRIVGGKYVSEVTLPEGVVAAGTLEVRGPEEAHRLFANLIDKSANVDADTDSLSGFRQRTDGRLLVIGSRPGLDTCGALEVRETTRSWEVRFAESSSSTGSVSCAIEFPDDGREIHFLGERVDE